MLKQDIKKILNRNITPYFKKDLKEIFPIRPKFSRQRKIKPKKNGSPLPSRIILGLAVAFLICGFLWGVLHGNDIYQQAKDGLIRLGFVEEPKPAIQEPELPSLETNYYQSNVSQEKAIIQVVENTSPSVVSIAVFKNEPVIETYYETQYKDLGNGFGIEYQVPKQRQKGTQKVKKSEGSGFIVSSEGMVLTNQHVIAGTDVEYQIITNNGEQYEAVLLDKDPFQDLAILKIQADHNVDEQGNLEQKVFPVLELADSDGIQIGQTVVAIGNALGEFSNTVSVGIVSGLSRNIVATGGGVTENLEGLIQTDAAINKGNSGGPLLNLKAEVIGVNVAMAETAQNIGFAIPINDAAYAVRSVQKFGIIKRPFLGVVYRLVTPELKAEQDLPVNYGAWIVKEDGAYSIIPDSAAAQAGLKEGDIILEADGIQINLKDTLAKLIRLHYPGDTIRLKILRDGQELLFDIVLGEKTSDGD